MKLVNRKTLIPAIDRNYSKFIPANTQPTSLCTRNTTITYEHGRPTLHFQGKRNAITRTANPIPIKGYRVIGVHIDSQRAHWWVIERTPSDQV